MISSCADHRRPKATICPRAAERFVGSVEAEGRVGPVQPWLPNLSLFLSLFLSLSLSLSLSFFFSLYLSLSFSLSLFLSLSAVVRPIWAPEAVTNRDNIYI